MNVIVFRTAPVSGTAGAGARGAAGLGRIDVRTLADEGEVMLPEEATFRVYPGVAGRLYGTRVGTSPSGVFGFEVIPPTEPRTPGPIPTRTLLYDHDSVNIYAPEPSGRSVGVGKHVVTADMRENIAELPGDARRFLVTKPVLLCGGERDGRPTVIAVSTNTFKEVGRATLADPSSRATRRRGGDPTGFRGRTDVLRQQTRQPLLDEKNGTGLVFNGYEWQASFFSLAALSLPDEPFLTVATRPASPRLVAGASGAVELVPADPSARLTLKSGPDGLKLDGRTLRWTPGVDRIGGADVVITVAVGESTQDQTLRLNVEFPGVELPLAVAQVVTSPDGTAALVTDQAGTNSPHRGNRDAAQGTSLAIVDLKKPAVVAKRTMGAATSAVGLDDRYAYVALAESDALLVLNRADLTDAKRVFTSGRVTAIVPAGEKVYFSCQNQRGGGETMVLTPPEFKPVPVARPSWSSSPANVGLGGNPTSDLPSRAGAFWAYRGVIYDAAMSKPVMLVQPQPFVLVGNAGGLPASSHGRPDAVAPFHTVAYGFGGGSVSLSRIDGRQIKRLDGFAGAVLPDLPAAVTLQLEPLRGAAVGSHGSRDQIGTALVMKSFDLITGMPRRSWTFWGEATDRSGRGSGANGGPGVMAVSPDGSLVVARGRRIGVVPTAAFADPELKAPLWVPPAQSALRLDPAAATKLAFKPTGGTPPYAFELPVVQPGVDLDAGSGTVTVTAGPFVERAADAVAFALTANRGGMEGAGQTPEQNLAAYVAAAGAEYARLAGAKANGVAVAVPITVVVRDAEQQTQTVRQTVLIDVPADPIRARLAQLAAERPAAAPQRAFGGPATQPSGPGGTDEVTTLRRRVIELERENARLEGKIEALQEALGISGAGRAPRSTTRPSP